MSEHSSRPTVEDVGRLKEAAMRASRNSYSPYSRFPVGAALMTETGEIYAGTNVENASFGLTICAERSAIFRAVATGARQIAVIVIYTPTETTTTPCGACRQVINEFGPDADVYSVCDKPSVQSHHKLSELLPAAFGPGNLPE
jgi:cytidine deaminase